MSVMMTIARREFRSYFDSPLAYVVICLSYFILGLALFEIGGGFFASNKASLRTLFSFVPVGLAVLVVPVMTMRLIAEERHTGTLEMLVTLPVRDSDVVLGKYFGALGLVFTLIVATLAYPIAMFVWPWQLGSIDPGPIVTGYLGVILFAFAAVSVGLLVSSLTRSQATAFFITVIIFLLSWLCGLASQDTMGDFGSFLAYISFTDRLFGFARGLIELRDVVYFGSITVVSVIFSFWALERRRWA